MVKWLLAGATALALVACAGDRGTQTAGGVLDPVCAPDGSVVFVTYSNSEQNFETAEASRANCSWNQE